MIKRDFFSILFIILSMLSYSVYAADAELLSSYMDDASKGKSLTLPLRLKKVDYTFKTISFYDKDNVDIVFDIDRFEKKPRIARSMRTIHEGMRYYVVFVVRGKGNDGLLEGELTEFKPIFLDKIP